MRSRIWLWLGSAINVVLLWPGFYMAVAATQLANESRSALAIVIAALFFALPVFCIAATLAAWRVFSRFGSLGHSGVLLGAPLVYAGFLTAFLLSGG